MSDDTKNVRSTTYGAGQVTISGLSPEEVDKVVGIVNLNNGWMSVEHGQLKTVPSYKDLPGPIDDESMLPFWRQATKDEMAQPVLFDDLKIGDLNKFYSHTIIIQHLCGYYYTPEKYRENAKKLESYGFECLRSRRGADGKYSENWQLTYLGDTQGALKIAIDLATRAVNPVKENLEQFKLEATLSFLRENVTFGTLDITVQK